MYVCMLLHPSIHIIVIIIIIIIGIVDKSFKWQNKQILSINRLNY